MQSIKLRSVHCIAAAMLSIVLAAPLFSQGNTGRILGSVRDQTGLAIVGAQVTVTDLERGTPRTLGTDEAGAYNVPSLPPGNYRIRVEY